MRLEAGGVDRLLSEVLRQRNHAEGHGVSTSGRPLDQLKLFDSEKPDWTGLGVMPNISGQRV
jgi:hypothetical protein